MDLVFLLELSQMAKKDSEAGLQTCYMNYTHSPSTLRGIWRWLKLHVYRTRDMLITMCTKLSTSQMKEEINVYSMWAIWKYECAQYCQWVFTVCPFMTSHDTVCLTNCLPHWDRDKLGFISQTTFSSALSWMNMWINHWNLFLMVQLTKSQHFFR